MMKMGSYAIMMLFITLVITLSVTSFVLSDIYESASKVNNQVESKTNIIESNVKIQNETLVANRIMLNNESKFVSESKSSKRRNNQRVESENIALELTKTNDGEVEAINDNSQLINNGIIEISENDSINLIAGPTATNLTSTTNPISIRKRYVFDSKNQSYNAVNNGCEIIESYDKFEVLSCDEKTAEEFNLSEDLEIFVSDIDVNEAVSANFAANLDFTGKGVTIAILDSGYNYNHPDLASSYAGGYDFVNNDDDPMDDYEHGSHVAGIITSDGIDSRSKGIAPDAKIVAIKVLDQYGSGYLSKVANSIYYTVDNYDVDVISISISTASTYSDYCDNANVIIKLFNDAVVYAHQKNVNVVVAAGNTGASPSAPGCISGSFSVGYTNNDLVLKDSSARGPTIDIYAPGSNVYSTVLNNDYAIRSGTSMAAPLVAGSIALLKEKNSNLNYIEYENALTSKATLIEADFGTMKVLNVSSAIKSIIPLVCAKPKLSYAFVNGQVVVSFQSELGCNYNLDKSDDLTYGSWYSVETYEGNGEIMQFKTYPTGLMGFFRINLI